MDDAIPICFGNSTETLAEFLTVAEFLKVAEFLGFYSMSSLSILVQLFFPKKTTPSNSHGIVGRREADWKIASADHSCANVQIG